MKSVTTLLLLIFFTLAAHPFLTAQPVNDECSGAIALPPQPLSTPCNPGTPVNFTGATISNFDCLPGSSYYDVWYSFTATSTEHYLRMQNVTATGSFKNIFLKTYTDCSGGGGSNCKTIYLQSSIQNYFPKLEGLSVGVTYYLKIAVDNFGVSDFQICLITPPPPPTNDDCPNAIELTPQPYALSCTGPTLGYTLGATNSGLDCPSGSAADDDVWFKFTAATKAQIIRLEDALVFNGNSQASFEIGVYTDCSSGYQTCIYGLNSGSDRTEEAHLDCLTPGTTYYLKISTSLYTNPAQFKLCVINVPTPANDVCSSATVLTGQPFSGACTAPVSATTLGAGENTQCGLADVWFSFVATATSELFRAENIEFRFLPNSPSLYLQLFAGCDGSQLSGFVNVTYGSQVAIFSGLTVGQTYYLRAFVSAIGGGGTANFNLCMIHPPTNDECATAYPLTVHNSTSCGGETMGLTNTATGSIPANPCSGTADDDVWYSFVATACSHKVTVTSLNTLFDPVLELRSGGCPGTNVMCVDFFGGGESEFYYFDYLTIGATYFVRIWGSGSTTDSRGAFNICITTPTLMAYASSACTGNGSTVPAGTQNAEIVRMNINFSGVGCPMTVTQIRVNTLGTTDNTDIYSAKIYFTSGYPTLNIADPATQLFGTAILSPGTGTLTFSGSIPLVAGTPSTNYFWLVYDVSPCATVGNVLDGRWVDFTFSGGSPLVPTNNNPSGSRSITTLAAISSVADGNWSSPATWGGCLPPASTTGILINSNVILDASYSMPSANLTINYGKSLTINSNTLTIGPSGGGNKVFECYGSLSLGGSGRLDVNGRVQFLSQSSFTMTDGELNIDGNNGNAATSIGTNTALLYFGEGAGLGGDPL